MSKAQEFEKLFPADRGQWCKDNYDLILRALKYAEVIENNLDRRQLDAVRKAVK